VTKPPADLVRDFSASMPAEYRRAHDPDAIACHARIASERGSRLTHVGLCPAVRGAKAGLCVIAEDRPGLLATISAALVMEGLDVLDAEAHTRKTPAGRPEAVDIFSVQRAEALDRDRPLEQRDAERLRDLLTALLEGGLDAQRIRKRVAPVRPCSETVVRFLEDKHGVLSTLEVETDDRSGLLLALSQALFDQRVQIVESEVKTVGERVRDRFQIVELDGRPIGTARRLEIQVAILSAVQASTG
jgi:[protein-PII] uridylyltransferase